MPRPRRQHAWVLRALQLLLAWLLAAPPARADAPGGEPEVANVTTPELFRRAVQERVHYILVTRHLDLRALTPARAATDGAAPVLFFVQEPTKAIQGVCFGKVSKPEIPPQEPLLPQQCHLLLTTGFLAAGAPGDRLWLHNLYISKLASGSGRLADSLIDTVTHLGVDRTVELYASSVTLQGDGVNGVAIVNSGSVYMSDCKVFGFAAGSSNLLTAPVLVTYGAAFLTNTTISNNTAVFNPGGIIHLINRFATLQLQDVDFSDNLGLSMLSLNGGDVYSDDPQQLVLLVAPRQRLEDPRPLTSVPPAAFLSAEDPWFTDARFVVNQVIPSRFPISPATAENLGPSLPPSSSPPSDSLDEPPVGPPAEPLPPLPPTTPNPSTPRQSDASDTGIFGSSPAGFDHLTLIVIVVGAVAIVALICCSLVLAIWLYRRRTGLDDTFIHERGNSHTTAHSHRSYGGATRELVHSGPLTLPLASGGHPQSPVKGPYYNPSGYMASPTGALGPAMRTHESLEPIPSIVSHSPGHGAGLQRAFSAAQSGAISFQHSGGGGPGPRWLQRPLSGPMSANEMPGGGARGGGGVEEWPHAAPGASQALAGDGPVNPSLVEAAFDELHHRNLLFMNKYVVLSCMERRSGGQGIVQFVHHPLLRQDFVVKCYLRREAFERERDLFALPQLKPMMAATHEVLGNEDGSVRAPSGFVFPACIVMERGESLEEFARANANDPLFMVQAIILLAIRVQALHAAGFAHRDLKPGNVLRLPRHQAWTLIDFGCCAQIGTQAPLSFSLSYAPPEVVYSLETGKSTITATAEMDIWSLGVIAFELLTGGRVFPQGATPVRVCNQIMGRAPLPWESERARTEKLPRLGQLQDSVLACLDRDPTARPTADGLVHTWNAIFTSLSAGNRVYRPSTQ